jgi:hypothetical protein
LSNLFLHYCFDSWVERTFPFVPWCRYADDGLLHCSSLKQAIYIKDCLSDRLKECGLEIHPEKTKIIYCRDGRRRGEAENYEFDFLGYSFRTRTARRRRDGHLFDAFGPSVSRSAVKAMKRTIKHDWKFQNKLHLDLKMLAKNINPVMNGWIGYYCRYNASDMKPVYDAVNKRIKQWAKRKYKKLNGHETRASNWLTKVYQANPKLFAHWKMVPVY